MLGQRVLTALVLLAILVAALLAPSPWPLLLLFVLLAGCALWEWLRLTLAPAASVLALPAAVLFALVLLAMIPAWVAGGGALPTVVERLKALMLPLAAAGWLIGVPVALWRARVQARRHVLVLSLAGLVAVTALWLSLAQLFLAHGAWFLVSMMALIWFADSVAYFAGRAWGRRRLAPAISPGKTLEGAIAGVLGATLWMAVTAGSDTSFAAALVQRWGWPGMLALSVLLAVMSIAGDLFESLLKRRAGSKDSSRLLPGHGGVLDRIDALLPVAPLALLLTQS
ncbi:MAG: phosphatidate cytidylyltransferase [Castellaniella sp.]